jgi:hypothetical protein
MHVVYIYLLGAAPMLAAVPLGMLQLAIFPVDMGPAQPVWYSEDAIHGIIKNHSCG